MQNSPGQAGSPRQSVPHFPQQKRSPQSVTAKWVIMTKLPVHGLRWKSQGEITLVEGRRKPLGVQEWLGFIPYQFEWSYPFFGTGRKQRSTGTRQHLASLPETVPCFIAFNQ